MLSNLSTLTNDPLSLWEWTVPDEGYCTGSTAPGESQFTNMKRKSRKNCKYFRKPLQLFLVGHYSLFSQIDS